MNNLTPHPLQPALCSLTAALSLAILLTAFSPTPAAAGIPAPVWSTSPSVNNPVQTGNVESSIQATISDGMGGSIIFWNDYQGFAADVYAQKLDALGNPLWASPNGQPLITGPDDEYLDFAVTDGAGGAIFVYSYEDAAFDFKLYAQRINSAGLPQWGTRGIAVATTSNTQAYVHVVSDGLGGALVAWQDYRNHPVAEAYVTRFMPDGSRPWGNDGLFLGTADNTDDAFIKIAPDGAGGGILAWHDIRTTPQLFAQRVLANGTPQWLAGGVPVGTGYDNTMISDGLGGAYLCWLIGQNLHAQRLSPNGTTLWNPSGIPVCSANNSQNDAQLCLAANNGLYIQWEDNRATDANLYAQHINTSGALQWASAGLPVCVAASDQYNCEIVPDSAGGLVLAWEDGRDGIPTFTSNVYAQRILPDGTALWPTDGVNICTHPSYMPKLAADGAGGAIIAWNDARLEAYQIYASHLVNNGQLGPYPGNLSTVGPGTTGTISGGVNAAVQIVTNTDTDGLYLQFHVNETVPGGTFSSVPALAPDGLQVIPDSIVGDRFWEINALGVGPQFTYRLTLDAAPAIPAPTLSRTVILKRAHPLDPWVPCDTTLTGNTLRSSLYDSFSQFALGTGPTNSAITDWAIYK